MFSKISKWMQYILKVSGNSKREGGLKNEIKKRQK
jgi:hypothetical protein